MGLAMLCSGCQLAGKKQDTGLLGDDWKSGFAKPADEKIEYGQPERMAVIWTDSTASADGTPSKRGFGGRIYFYDKNNKPVRVEGELSIYAFDDSIKTEKTTPDRVYKFRQTELQQHFSETQLGPSYSVWLPWDTVGGERKTIALMPVFKGTGNAVVNAGMSINVLQGKTPAYLANLPKMPYRVLGSSPTVGESLIGSRPKNDYGVQLVSGNESLTPEQIRQRERTTTIEMPRQMAQRLNQDLAHGSVDHVAPGMQADVSFGPRTTTGTSDAEEMLGSAENLSGTSSSAGQSSANETSATRSRPVFGAPGALK